MSYLRRKTRGERMSQRSIEVPLADELFETMQGFHGAYARPYEEIEPLPPESRRTLRYHTYVNTIVGHFDDPDVETTLRLGFEAYLRRLRENTQPTSIQKPCLFWRFRRGEHIALESNGRKRDPLVQLRTRLVVPSCSLLSCEQCLHTEGEEHAKYCTNIVSRENVQVPKSRVR